LGPSTQLLRVIGIGFFFFGEYKGGDHEIEEMGFSFLVNINEENMKLKTWVSFFSSSISR
jgi:hypothetical protein